MQDARRQSANAPGNDTSDDDQARAAAPPTRDAAILEIGSRFGDYVVGPAIGHGGMARIYRAEHESLHRHVALKVLSSSFARNPEGRERFIREGRIAAAVRHPNVVSIFDVGVQGDLPYIVMELLEGEDLEVLLRRRGVLDETTIVDVLVPIVAGLVAVHEAGVVHRDLKPGNVFLARGSDESLEPQLLDFGISRSMSSEDFRLTLNNGLLMGTPMYMAPEYIRGEEVTPLSDQYSLGVLIYECATGLNPFASDSLAETMRRVTSGSFAPPNQHNPRVSPRLSRIILRAMSLEPSERYADLRALGRQLLLLAGQRTRVTWGLSFGEAALLAAGRVDASEPLAQRPRAHKRAPRRPSAWTRGVAAGFILVTLGSVAAVGWVNRAEHSRAQASADVQTETYGLQTVPPDEAARASESAPVALPRAPVRNANRPEGASTDAAMAKRRSPSAPEASESVRASRHRSTRLASATDDDRSSSPRAPRRRARRATRPPSEVERRARETERPDWLLPARSAVPSSAPRAVRTLGTNKAPILD